jgi:flagellar biosynthesis/type III secretory pathway M-ring protein FliF/YscJ
MPVWSWFFIAAAAVIAFTLVLVVVLSAIRRKRTERLKKHFGPEYERAVGDAGDQRAAEEELVARERKRQKLDIVALSPEARARYAEHWRTVQTAFVDSPSRAPREASGARCAQPRCASRGASAGSRTRLSTYCPNAGDGPLHRSPV